MKKIIVAIVLATLALFAGKLHINFNDGTPTVEIDFTDLNHIEIIDDMVLIPGGTYMRGDHFDEGWSGELPVHQVTLNSFYMSRFLVTQKEWRDILGSNPAHSYGVGDNYPVYYISWYAIIKYCNLRSKAEGFTPVYTIDNSTNPADWGDVPDESNEIWDAVVCDFSANGYRLPTDAEWEYAARGGLEGQRFPNGATISHGKNGDTQANYRSSWRIDRPNYFYDVSQTEGHHPDFNGTSSPVGTFPPNGYGLYDMSGNLWEWSWDWWHYYTEDAQVNPTGPEAGSFRTVRGGGHWQYDAYYCRVSNRNLLMPLISYDRFIGFRVVRSH